MRREYFGLAGGLFTDQQLARVVVLAAENPSALRAFLRGRSSIEELAVALEQVGETRGQSSGERNVPLAVDLQAVRGILANAALRITQLTQLRDRLDRIWRATFRREPPPYALNLRRAGGELDRQWLVQMLQSEPRIASAFFESRRPRAGVWTWPLRIGVPQTVAGQRLHEQLLAAKFRQLFEPVVVEGDNDSVDLLLIPGPLTTAGSLHSRGSVVADAVLVLGGADLEPARANTMLSSLATRYSAGLSGVCFVPGGERLPWVQTLVRELSHNFSLPSAVFAAKNAKNRERDGGGERIGDLVAPVLLGDTNFIGNTTIASAAIRFGEVLMQEETAERAVIVDTNALPVGGVDGGPILTAKDLGRAIVENVERFSWLSEQGDATALVNLRAAVERQLGSVGLERPPAAVSLPETAAPSPITAGNRPPKFSRIELPELAPDVTGTTPGEHEPEERHVQAKISPLTELGAEVRQLSARTDYRLQVHIGLPQDDTIVADKPLDESKLPISEFGHALQIIYCPLSPIHVEGKWITPDPVQATVHLPKKGESTKADFVLRCGEDAGKFRARLIVSHQNRVLQTLRISAASEENEIQLQDENRYSASFGTNPITAPVDIAFVVNDNPEGASGVATVVGGGASFIEPPGLKGAIEAIEELLSQSNIEAAGEASPALDDERIVKLLIELAMHGSAIVTQLRRQHPVAIFESAEHVQVLEALDKVYLPVEFFYSGEAPAPTAKLCPNAAAALDGTASTIHASCPHRKDEGYVCPAAFWGFSKHIERFASTQGGAHVFAEPKQGADRLGPFKTALLAASEQAADEMKGESGVPTAVAKLVGTVEQALSWDEWKEKVSSLVPRLMLLLPHSANSPTATTVPALEVSGTWLETPRIKPKYVAPDGSDPPGPLVLLLGCSTHLASIEYLNAVQRFFQEGAPVVLGTLATVHASQASRVACTLIEVINEHNGTPDTRFYEVLLRLKRRLLVDGHDVAIGLVAYGHSSWRI